MATSDFTDRIRKLSPAKLVLLAEQLQVRLTAAEQARREPIAIVGIGCRFPGGVTSPETFWDLLRGGGDGVREIPSDRWDVDGLYDPDISAPGKMATRWGGFLDGVDQFDPHFFGIAPREAVSMDPQQRLLLEVTWEALEHAAIPGDGLAGSSTGVFVGISGCDYQQLQVERGLAAIDTYLASGTAHSIASGRVAYVLGAQGPTFSVDTACSSSLVAIHSAVLSLRAGECSLALAGGVNLVLSPVTTIALSKAQMMAPDGRCKAFDARANGFVRGEGAGMLVLRRLSDAVAAGDRVLAVIRGSAVNQDGRSNGLTAPNGPSQESVIRAALDNAGVSPAEVGYVEAHGTGTSLGDPIEVQALAAALGRGRDRGRPVLLGSVKTNIGHLESAAGIAGLIKAVLAIQHGEIPPHKHLETPNPLIPWNELPVTIPTELTPWGEPGARIAGVSSFGFSGTNAHIVLAEAPGEVAGSAAMAERPLHVLTLSARSAAALREQVSRAAADVDRHADRFADVCHTAAAGRAHFPHRLAIVAGSAPEARALLARAAAGEKPAGVVSGHLDTPRPRGLAFLFTGQGSQYVGMGRRLYETQPAFAAALDRCAALLDGELERPLLSVMFGRTEADGALLAQTTFAQPAIFALQYALAALWQSWGVQPTAVMGHSVGEFAAACVAGACSLEDGARLIAARARLMGSLPAGGTMAAVFAPAARVEAALDGTAAVAAFNGPENIVITGLEADVARALDRLQGDGIRGERLRVSHAFHSSLMEPVLGALRDASAAVAYAAPRVTLVSNLTGAAMGRQELAAADYWCRHLRQPVQFERGVQALVQAGSGLFLEIGPHPVLLGMAAQCIGDGASAWLPSLRRGRDDWESILPSLASLYANGVAIDWQGFDRPYRRQHVHLSSYPFQRSRYWIQGAASPVVLDEPGTGSLPGRRVAAAGIREIIFETTAAALVAAGGSGDERFDAFASAALRSALGSSDAVLTALTIRDRDLSGGTRVQAVVTLGPQRSGTVEIFARAADGWRAVASAAGAAVDAPRADDRIGRLLFEIEWQPHALAAAGGAEPAAAFLADPTDVRGDVSAAVPRLYDEHGLARFGDALPRLDALCAAYVTQAFARLGWTFVPQQHVTAGEIARRCRVLPRHARLLERLLQILEEDGLLKRSGDGWDVQRPPSVSDPAEIVRALLEEFPAQEAEFTLTSRCGDSLADALRGDVDPLQLLFPGGSLHDTEKLYQQSPVARAYNALMRAALDAALAKLPSTAAVRVLEIGGGTGGTTSALLSRFPADRTEYWFTDMSRLFSASARDKFRAYPFIRFANLDISADPRAQGFRAGSFDIIVAANVLHATPDVRATLKHVRSLLAPGGILLLLEASCPERYADLTVGLTDGWWAFQDADLRPHHALMPRDRWIRVLQECGFPDAVAVPGADAEGVLARQAVIVARASADAGTIAAPRWLLFDDASGIAEATAAGLSRRGAAVVRVRPGDRYARVADDTYRIDPSSAEDYRRVIAAVFAEGVPAAGVAHLWSLDADMPAELTPAALERQQQFASMSALRLVQALAQHGSAVPLWLVTRGAQVVRPGDGEAAALAQAPVWGLGHSVALEHPELRCVRVDLDPSATVLASADDLVTELLGRDTEDQIAWRESVRLARRLVWSKTPSPSHGIRFRDDASYLITGGLRGLGPVFARWMADHGARHLVLVGRRGAGDEANALMADLGARGVTVHAMQADVADYAQLAQVFSKIDRGCPPLRGIIHSAGMVDDAVVMQQTWERMARVMNAKVRGSWHLVQLTRDRALDFVALCSTGVSMVGSAGQANHAAANAFVDVLAPWLRSRGVPAVALNWGAWADVGAAVGVRLSGERWAERIPPADGLEAFDRILQPVVASLPAAPAQVGVLAADWQAFLDAMDGQEPPLYRDIARASRRSRPAAAGGATAEQRPLSLAGELEAAAASRRPTILRAHIRRLAAGVLGVADPGTIELQQPLRELGLDSLMAVQLRNQLSKALERPLPATLLFEYPTVKALVDFASATLGMTADAAAASPAIAIPSLASLDDATDDELASALAARLDKFGQQ